MEEWFLFKVKFPLNSFFFFKIRNCLHLNKMSQNIAKFWIFCWYCHFKNSTKLEICWKWQNHTIEKKHLLHTYLTFDQLFIKTGNLLKMTKSYYWKKHQLHTNLTFDHLYIFVETLSIAARKMTLGFFKQRKK